MPDSNSASPNQPGGKLTFKQIALILSALLVVLLIISYYNIEWLEEEVDLGYGEEATRNPYLAVELFLKQYNINSSVEKSLNLLKSLPSTDDTIIITTSRHSITQKRHDELMDWVNRGGYLIITSVDFFDEAKGNSGDLMLDHFDARLYKVVDANSDEQALDDEEIEAFTNEDAPETIGELIREAMDTSIKCYGEDDLMQISFSDREEALQANASSTRYLYDGSERASAAVSNDYGNQLLQYEHGQGLVTIMTDLGIWQNANIGCYDHAYVFWRLLGDGKAWILYREQTPSLFKLMLNTIPYALLALVLLIGFWLWHRSLRFGPLININETTRRELLEHIDAAAGFSWRQHKARRLHAALADDIDQHMQSRHWGYRQLSRVEQCQLIAQLADLDHERVDWALNQDAVKNETEFLQKTQLLQTIRKQL